MLINKKTLVVMANSTDYVESMIAYDMHYIEIACVRQRCASMRNLLTYVYSMQQRIVFFIEGQSNRYDRNHINKLIILAERSFEVVN